MKWSDDASKELQKVPVFVRSMAKRAVEKEASTQGKDTVMVEDVRAAREKYISFAEKGKDPKITRVAVVRCDIVSEVCPGTACFAAFNARKLNFSEYGPNTEMIAFFTCGGCPGRRVPRLVDKLTNHGIDVVHLSSCMMMDSPDYPRCPHRAQIRKAIEAKGIRIVEGTHH
ncbi:MAG: CGGC domain-containing protein [Candidatus Saccharibacteria bacterium]